LQFIGEGLRLFEEVFGARVGLDGVEDDANGFDELVQKGLVRGAELLPALQRQPQRFLG